MDSDSTNSREDDNLKISDEAANGCIDHTAAAIGGNNSSFIDGEFIDDTKMPASAAAYHVSSDDNNNHDEANIQSTKDSKPPTTVVGTKNDGGLQENNGYHSSTARLDTNEEDDRKMPSIQQTKTRGRPQQRHHDIETIVFQSTTTPDNGFVPLKVIHVPNKHHYASAAAATTTAAVKRAPSVPDLTSLQHYQNQTNNNEYYNHHHHRRRRHSSSRSTTPPPLSDVILKIKERGGDQKQQFEERLRRADLRLTSDNNMNVTRYRSKSTPSRGGGGGGGGGEKMAWGESNNNDPYRLQTENRRRSDNSNSHHGSENEQHHHDADSIHQSNRHSSPAPLEEVHLQDVHRSSADPIHITSSSNEKISATAPLQTSSVKSSGISVAAGSHRSHGSSFDDGNNRRTILEPPPPPPPTTERERLVERERQARLETERARRRHIALQRERQLEENNEDDHHNGSGVSFHDNGSDDDRNALIGQISFEEGDDGIPSPPIPPPPATEKERLVERERQARLETERARRRHLAFQREQQLEMDEQHQIAGDENDSHEYIDPMPDSRLDETPPVEVLPESFVSPIAATRDSNIRNREASTESVVSSGTGHGSGAKAVTQTNEAEATSLSYPMERFLETLGDETANAPNNVEIPPIVDNEESSLPYTMELFLAENAVGVSVDSHRAENEAPIEHHDDSIILASSNSLDLPPALSTDGVSDLVMNDNIVPSNLAEAVGLSTERHVNSDVSDGGPLGDNESVSLSDQHSHPRSELRDSHSPSLPLDDSTLDSPELITSRLSRPITEADIAQLAEVEHASIGNAAPQSIRDEPSETSIPRRPLLDQAFSVATQTTLIDSVTETSVGRSHLMSEANQSRGSSNIIRVGGSVETTSSGGASSASIEAVPSNVSDEESDDDSHLIINPPSTRSDTHTQSLADDSNVSPDTNFRMPELREADVVALAEIDYASIGNAPPLSVRDERLSESSVTERGGRQFSVATRISEMDSIDENSILRGSPFRGTIDEDSQSNLSIPEQDSIMPNESENTSVEVMPSDRSDNTGSHNSVEVMLSEDDDNSLHDGRRVADIDDMASSASIEAAPSLNIGDNLVDMNGSSNRLAMYGATSEAGSSNHYHNSHRPSLSYDHDEESSPLIPPHLSTLAQTSSHPHTGSKSAPHDKMSGNTKILIFFAAEIPHFFIVTRGNNLLCPIVGMRRYQIILATMIILASLFSQFKSEIKEAAWPLKSTHLKEVVPIGAFIGVIGLIMGGLDIAFALGMILSVTIAIVVAKLCAYHVVVLLKSCKSDELREIAAAACGDCVRSFMLLCASYVIFNFVALLSSEGENMC